MVDASPVPGLWPFRGRFMAGRTEYKDGVLVAPWFGCQATYMGVRTLGLAPKLNNPSTVSSWSRWH